MVLARKSAVSKRGNWFRRDSILSLGRRRSAPMESAARSASTPANPAVPASSQRQQRSSKNSAVSWKNEAVSPKSVKELDRKKVPNLNQQSSGNQKSLRTGFLNNLPTMSNPEATPLWLLRLYTFHRYSSVFAFLLVTSTLAIYGWTVYSQEVWGKSYHRLQNLQLHERMLTTTNATLTNKMAKEAEQSTAGLVSPTPQGMIFLPPASHSPKPASSNTTPNSEKPQQTLSPLGY